jgi:hypothetical protein
MVRAGIALILFVTVFAMMRGVSTTWRKQLPDSPVAVGQKVTGVEGLPEMMDLQPTAPAVMPDLSAGYLFNEARLIESEADKNAQALASAGNDLGINADIGQLTYSGSLIGDTFSKALVSFPPSPKSAGPPASRGRQRRTPKGSALETAQLEIGDVLSGYQVAAISAEKITFKKGDEVLEKFLYDPDKKRVAPIRSNQAPPAMTPNRPPPAPARGAAPRQTTTGQSAEALPAEAIPADSDPGAPRRMVVSRRPPPRPDTSRGNRRERLVRPSVSTPPMPTSQE